MTRPVRPSLEARRAERRAARRNRGLVRPGPVNTRTVNLASVSTKPDAVRAALFATLTLDPAPDLVLAVECSDITIKDHIDTRIWQVLQCGRDLDNPDERIAQSGSALIARRTVVTLDRGRLREGSPAGEGIRTRYTLTARARFHPRTLRRWRTRITVGHAPPRRAPIGRGRFLNTLRGLGGIRGGDTNVPSSTMRHLFPLNRLRSTGVMHLVLPPWIPASDRGLVDIGTDHKALDVTLYPTRNRKK